MQTECPVCHGACEVADEECQFCLGRGVVEVEPDDMPDPPDEEE